MSFCPDCVSIHGKNQNNTFAHVHLKQIGFRSSGENKEVFFYRCTICGEITEMIHDRTNSKNYWQAHIPHI